jgi:hypothetical protein
MMAVMVTLWHRSCGGTVPPRPGSDGLVNLIVTVRIRFTSYTSETGIAGKRGANNPYWIVPVRKAPQKKENNCRAFIIRCPVFEEMNISCQFPLPKP